MWMVIIGIAGGTALILTGFGLRDSIGAASTQQFGKITNYQALMMVNQTKRAKVNQSLQQNSHFRSATAVNTNTVTVSKSGHQVAQVTQLATNQPQTLKKYIKLESTTTKKPLSLASSGIILTKKAAQTLDVTVGEHVKIKTATNQSYSVKIGAIAKNYTGNFVYMNAKQFHQATGTKYQTNAELLKLTHLSTTQEHKLAQQLIASGAENVSYISAQKKIIDQEAHTLDPIVFIFIILSALLSFVVLYNLTNINVSERIRELSTIKVLGFFDREVTMYVTRENIVLTIVGIIFGYGLGNLLTAFILQKAASDAVIFPLVIGWSGYAIAALLTIVFTIIVTIFTHYKLTKIDMVDALKSNE
ncbi:ABC transporter permease [Paucilactobacillus hokkaidonensis]|nr:ABC transporter permease [Paucilactobacillus hokkaidonensis]